ncbi:glycosyltransferase family 2 protein [Dentipellis sp. KUC8613]|nr:glycosyltransferase family 2 protein [Dentipellis sp. KUC8613]
MTGKQVYVVTGGNGFIGSHVAVMLRNCDQFVRIVDIKPTSLFTEPICDELVVGNLCDPAFCTRIVQGAHTVLHFAAVMGGMGTIHEENDFEIYEENQAMTVNIVRACIAAGVKRLFYASSACVYPESLQGSDNKDVSLREDDVWAKPPPKPQGLYGLEKLVSEILLQQFESKMTLCIARFHNVYGPRGAWCDGREKAPAALLRKAICARRLFEQTKTKPAMEVWGSGDQRRSFLYIEDCVQAIERFLFQVDGVEAKDTKIVNIGSDQSVTISELARIAVRAAGLEEADVDFKFDLHKPVGVALRNSNNEFVLEALDWRPATPLEHGLNDTALWMQREIDTRLRPLNPSARVAFLEGLQESRLVDMKLERTTFAVLLPITSRGAGAPEDCLEHLGRFAHSLERTTWRDMHQLGGKRFRIKIYLAIDAVDTFLLQPENKAVDVLLKAGFSDVKVLECTFPPGYICHLWRACARRAWEDGCDYFILLGDDVELQDEGWMRDAEAEFADIAKAEGVPVGFGCVAFTDTSFPGMPTFPIVHRNHTDVFQGDVVPDSFVNQDGDPFLFQLYRRFGCSRMFGSRIRNNLGGSDNARYEKQHAVDWTFGVLDCATDALEQSLQAVNPSACRKLTIDIIIPCYRVQMRYLRPILELEPSKDCTVMFIVIIDDPNSPHIAALEQRYAHRPDVRIRINVQNLGASASRNRGLRESAAEWAFFLDDDVLPAHDLLLAAERAIRAAPAAAGFVGTARLPCADRVFTAALHLAGVTYFWDIAAKLPGAADDLPWGVTANLIARRSAPDGVQFDLQFPKTGGGEDIDYVLRKRAYALEHGGTGFCAAPDVVVTHPWWNGGRRSYWRFYMWSKGDGGLVRMYPELTYFGGAPNSAEFFLLGAVMFLLGTFAVVAANSTWLLVFSVKMFVATLLANVVHDVYRHLWRDADRMRTMNTSVTGVRWFVAVVESSLVRMFSEWGRVAGILERGEVMLLGWRFDWFAGRVGDGPRNEERMNARQRAVLVLGILLFICRMSLMV